MAINVPTSCYLTSFINIFYYSLVNYLNLIAIILILKKNKTKNIFILINL